MQSGSAARVSRGRLLPSALEGLTMLPSASASATPSCLKTQKSICALTFTNRGVSTDCGINHAPPGANVWL